MVDVNIEIFYDGKTYKCGHKLKLEAIADIDHNYGTTIDKTEFNLIDDIPHSLLQKLLSSHELFDMNIYRTFNNKPLRLEYKTCQVREILCRKASVDEFTYQIACYGKQKIVAEANDQVLMTFNEGGC